MQKAVVAVVHPHGSATHAERDPLAQELIHPKTSPFSKDILTPLEDIITLD